MSLAEMNYMGGKRKNGKLLLGQVRFDTQVEMSSRRLAIQAWSSGQWPR